MTTATETISESLDLDLGEDLPVIHVYDLLDTQPKCGAQWTGSHRDCPGSGTKYRGQEACVHCGRPICEPCRQRFFRQRPKG